MVSGGGNDQALSTIFSYFAETDITAVPAAGLGHVTLLALSQNCSRPRATCVSCSPCLRLTAGGQMRTKLKRAVSSGTMGSETCLRPAAEQCDLGKGFDISEPV